LSIVAIIFARGGSKGLPDKNIRLFNGKPLISYSIEQALNIKEISRVLVSTDCPNIQKISLEHGAEVPFSRPSELAGDRSPEWLSWQHALKYLRDDEQDLPDILISLPAVAPLRSIGDIQQCLNTFKEGGCDAVVTMTKSNHSPYFNMVNKDNEGYISLMLNERKNYHRRQDAPEAFNLTTVAYVLSTSFVLKKESIFDGRVKSVIIPPARAIDIDNLLDFEIAEFLMSTRIK